MYKKIYYLAVFLLLSITLMTTCKLDNDKENSFIIPSPSKTPVLPAPDTPVVTAYDGMLTVRWNAVEGAEKYGVYVNTKQQPPASPKKTVTETTTVLTELSNKTTYYIWIKAITGFGSSDFSPIGRGTPWLSYEVPETPVTPVIISGVNQLTVKWEECGGAVSYEVYINTTPTPPYAPKITTDKTSAVIRNLENNRIYYIWVRSVNNAGKSYYSPVEAGEPREPTIAPVSPDTPLLTAGSHELTVSWQAVEFASAYEIWLGTTNNPNQAVKQGNDITGDIIETVITGLTNEITYYVWIKAKNIIGTSDFSPAASVKPSVYDALPLIPAAPAVTAGNRELIVNLSSAEGALSYEVWTGITDYPANAQKHSEDIFGTSTTLTGLTNNTTYYIWVKAKNNIGTSELSPRASGTPSAFAVPPPILQTAPTVTAGNGQLSVNWQAVEGASAYETWVGTDTNPTLATKRGSDVTGLSSVINGLTNGTVYYVWIKTKNTAGTSGFSPMATGTPQEKDITGKIPTVPAIDIGNEHLLLTWQAVEGATAYEVWVNTVNNSASALKNGTDITASLSTTIDGLTNGTTYYIWLKAKNNISESNFSSVVNGKPIANATIPILNASNGQLSVTWATIIGAEQYEVFCGTGINPPQNATQTINAPTTSATISGLTNGTTYTVWIRGKNTTGTGGKNSTSAKPIGNMETVTLTTGGSGELVLNWSAVTGADEYEVYYNTTDTISASLSQTFSTTMATINGLTNGTIYYFWVKGKNAHGTSNTSTVINGKPLGIPEAPILTPAYKQLVVTWTAVVGAEEYEVYYGIEIPTILAATTTGNTITINNLTYNTYSVRIRAKNAYGASYGLSAINKPTTIVPASGLYRGAEKIGSQNLAASLTWISNNAVSGDDFYIVLGANESISPKSLSYSYKKVEITLLGYSSERSITLSNTGYMFTVGYGVTLTLGQNITLVGLNGNTSALVHVNYDGKLIMDYGAKIKNNKYTPSSNSLNDSGGGVVNDGTFIMNGGVISGNTGILGGGVYSSGIFTMSGGSITSNTASYAGGGVYVYNINRIFTKSGGDIYSNIVSGEKNRGHEVAVSEIVNNSSYLARRRETAAGSEVNLDSSKSGKAGGWEN